MVRSYHLPYLYVLVCRQAVLSHLLAALCNGQRTLLCTVPHTLLIVVPTYATPYIQRFRACNVSSDCAADPNEEDFISSVHSGHEQQNVATSSPQQNALPREPTKWHWRKGVQLGKGAYGVVHLAHLVDTGQLVAVKQVGSVLLCYSLAERSPYCMDGSKL